MTHTTREHFQNHAFFSSLPQFTADFSSSSSKPLYAMAAPVAGEPTLHQQNSDHHLQHITYPHLADDDFTISQLIRHRISNPKSPSPPHPRSQSSSLGKRRKSKPVRYGVFAAEKTHPPSRHDTVVQDSSSKSLSSGRGKTAIKHVKSIIKSPPTMIKAEEIQSSLGTEHPSCIKMVKAPVDNGYWMGFPLWFGKLFLPKSDCEMVIEDENGEIYHLKYIADKSGLSAGWKKFAAGHNLVEGDALVFHLVGTQKFKVYIIRANDLNEVAGALSLLKSDVHTEQMISETKTPPTKRKTRRAKSLSLTMARKKLKLSTPSSQVICHRTEQSGNNSEEIGSEVLEGSIPSKSNLSLQELKTFKDFHIMVKGVCIDAELPDDVRMSYFKLCMDRKEFLHDCLPENCYYKLVAGMIGETVKIANEIKNCKLTTTKEEFDAWDNSLKSFSLLGMKVGFIRDKILKLSRLAFESENRLDIKRYAEAKREQKHVDDEVKRLTEELKKLKESSRKIQGIVDGLKQKAGSYEVKFQEEVNAPW